MKITNGQIQTFLALLAIIVAIITPEIRSKILGTTEKVVPSENKEFTETTPNIIQKDIKEEGGKSHNVNNQEIPLYQPMDYIKQTDPLKPKSEEEDYISFINPALNKSEISIVVVDQSNNIVNSVSSAIAEVYSKKGKITSIGLIRRSFIERPAFRDLCEGNSEIIERLRLNLYTDYLAIGKVNFAIRPGKLVDETIVCSASISMNIISTQRKSIVQVFTISNANGNGANESQAKENALQKLINKYYNDYTSF